MDTNSTPVPEQPGKKSPAAEAKTRRNRKVKRTLAGAFALTVGLTGAGVLATALTPDAQVATAQRDDQALIQEGNDIYDVACITCHGANLQGVEDRGPSLIGVGAGSVYFQVHSGRMPMMSNDAQAERKTPRYTEQQTLALAAYVAANGGGPDIVQRRRLHRDGRASVLTITARFSLKTLPVVANLPHELCVLPQLHRTGRFAVFR